MPVTRWSFGFSDSSDSLPRGLHLPMLKEYLQLVPLRHYCQRPPRLLLPPLMHWPQHQLSVTLLFRSLLSSSALVGGGGGRTDRLKLRSLGRCSSLTIFPPVSSFCARSIGCWPVLLLPFAAKPCFMRQRATMMWPSFNCRLQGGPPHQR